MLPIIKVILILFSFVSTNINNLKVTKKINEYIIGNEINLFNKRKKRKNDSLRNLKFSCMNFKKNMNSSTKNNNYNKNNDSSKIFINENNSKNENNNNNDISRNKTHTKNKKINITVIDDLFLNK